MKMKWGALVVDGRGKIGGHVASKNRSSAYLRTKVTPVNPQTSYQLGARNRFTGFSQAWSALTQDQRNAWNSAVADYAKTNIFGDLVNPSGFNLFQRLNNNRSICLQAQLNSPPLPGAVGVIVCAALTADVSDDKIELVMTGAVPALTYGKLFATPPLSPGKQFVKSQYRMLGVMDPAEATPYDATVLYKQKYGSVGAAGQKIFLKIVACSQNTGQEGTPSEVSAIVTA
jgi:hypothetical protein